MLKGDTGPVDLGVVDEGDWVAGVFGALIRAFLWMARLVYFFGPRPGYDWTTGRRSSGVYRATWQIGRVWFWLPVIAIAAALIYVVYFHPAIGG